MSKLNLLDFNRKALRDYFVDLGEKPFRADQIIKWIHQYGYQDFDQMTNLSKAFRQYLYEHAMIKPPKFVREQVSIDGARKWLFQLQDGCCVETVFIPEEGRGTLCVSSQVGCPLGCCFCATGKSGFQRNLSVAEIIGQVWQVVRMLSKAAGQHDRSVTNIVMMGMGEPLLNFDNVLSALDLMTDDFAYGLSKFRVTVSTVGIVPEMDRLSKESEVSLAVSLHAPNNALRDQLMPINKKYPIEEVIASCKRFFDKDSKRKISIEYVLLHDVNDAVKHARELVKLLNGLRCKVNLIPFNACSGISYQPSTPSAIENFKNILLAAGVNTIVRKRRGHDIAAACGQLAGC